MSNLKARKDAHTRDQYRKALTWFDEEHIPDLYGELDEDESYGENDEITLF